MSPSPAVQPRRTITSPDGRQAAIGDAMFALGELVGPDAAKPEFLHFIAQVAVDGALPALERDWRERDQELVDRATAAIERAVELVEAARERREQRAQVVDGRRPTA